MKQTPERRNQFNPAKLANRKAAISDFSYIRMGNAQLAISGPGKEHREHIPR
jgi:hypothetical protein